MQSIVQVLKVNDVKSGVSQKTGRPYSIQDAECILCKDDGTPDQVGVLVLPSELHGKVTAGVFIGSFAMRVDRERRIGAVLTGLQPYAVSAPKGAK